MKDVKELLPEINRPLTKITPDDSVHTALTLMSEKGLGALVVVQHGRVCGVVSERDCSRLLLSNRCDAKVHSVRSVMSEEVCFVSPNESMESCLALMNSQGLEHLPVIVGEELVGFLSLLDVTRSVLAEKFQRLQCLEAHLSSSWPL